MKRTVKLMFRLSAALTLLFVVSFCGKSSPSSGGGTGKASTDTSAGSANNSQLNTPLAPSANITGSTN